MIFITRSELDRMSKKVIDENTGMTALDLFENQHCYEDWQVIEDKQYHKCAICGNEEVADEYREELGGYVCPTCAGL